MASTPFTIPIQVLINARKVLERSKNKKGGSVWRKTKNLRRCANKKPLTAKTL